MGYGQYSAGGGMDRTKADMLAVFAGEGIASARKGGKNRLDATCADGRRIFTLHETVVAELSADGTRLTLRDGGWATPTTRTAWFDALTAWGIQNLDRWHGEICLPSKDEREVVYTVDALKVTARVDFTRQLMPMLRGSTGYANFAVTYDGVTLQSGSGAATAIRPVALLAALYRIDEMARRGRGRFAGQYDTLHCPLDFEVRSFSVTLGRSARYVCVGCHTFRTPDVRVFMREIEVRHPDAVEAAKRAFRAALPSRAEAA